MNAIRNYINRSMTRANCSPVIFGLIALVVLSVFIYHYRHVVEMVLLTMALVLLGAMVLYAAIAVTVAYRRSHRATAVQNTPVAAPAPAVPIGDFEHTRDASGIDKAAPVEQMMPPREQEPHSWLGDQGELDDLHAVSGVNADGTLS